MDREEAKRRLLDIERCTPIHTREDARDFEALETAIKALSVEPCEDCISRQAAKKALEDRFMELQKRHDDKRYETNYCLNTILELPPVTPKQKLGRWIEGFGGCECSECGCLEVGYSNYCPNCGAKMEESEAQADDQQREISTDIP